MAYRVLLITAILIVSMPLGAQVLERQPERYRLQQGDLIELNFPFTPEFNQTVTVQPDGFVNLRGIGDVHVESKTVPDMTAMLQQEYSSILKDPVITVVLKEFEKPYFMVNGQVASPGKYDMKGRLSLSQAVAMAGGFSGDARHSEVLIFRRVSGDWVEVKKIDLKKMLKGNTKEDVELRAGDMVYVPKKRLASLKPLMPVAALRLWFEPF